MTNTPRWRTVKDHGQPADDDYPVLYDAPHAFVKHRVLYAKGLGFGQSTTRWIPVAELLTLPDAPPPPRTVTIELDEDTARRIVDAYGWAPTSASGRAAAACRDALAKLDNNP